MPDLAKAALAAPAVLAVGVMPVLMSATTSLSELALFTPTAVTTTPVG